MNVGPTEALMFAIVVLPIVALYVFAAYTAGTWAAARRWPVWAAFVFGAVATLYAPVWLAIWVLMRWIGGPKPRMTQPARRVPYVDWDGQSKEMLIFDDLTWTRATIPEQQAALDREARARILEDRPLTPTDEQRRATFRPDIT